MKLLFSLFFTLFVCFTSYSQDKIYKKGGEIIEAKISEVGTSEIKYKVFKDTDGPTYTIEKDRILKVVYQNGRTELYTSSLKDPELYADQQKRALKINFLAPLRGYTQFNYEQNLRPGRSVELSLGVIGLGKRQQLDNSLFSSGPVYYKEQAGAFVSGGYKFSKMPDYLSGRDKYSHVLQGSYVKPEFYLGVYGQNFETNNGSGIAQLNKKTVVFSALMINLGKQWVLGDKLVLDVYGGLGYVVDNLNKITRQEEDGTYVEDYAGDHFGVITTGANSGFGFSGGLKLGILIK
jgi:hypothetical protein